MEIEAKIDHGGDENLSPEVFNDLWYKFITAQEKKEIRIPVMGHKELDLYKLYMQVLAFGGYEEVRQNVGTWSKIWKAIPNFDPTITDSSYRLRRNYEKYLLDFERRHIAPKTSEFRDDILEASERELAGLDSAILTRKRAQMIRETVAASLSASTSSEFQPRTTRTSTGQRAIHRNMWNHDSSSSESIDLSESDDSASAPIRTPSGSPVRHSLASSSSSAAPSPVSISEKSVSRTIATQSSTVPLEELKDLVVISLGRIVPQPPFMTQDSVWPICYHSRRRMYSMKNQGQITTYDCWITDSAGGPVFSAIPADDEMNYAVALSADECWTKVLDTATTSETRFKVETIISNGKAFFGVDLPEVTQSIQYAVARASINAYLGPRFNHLFQQQMYFNSATVSSATGSPYYAAPAPVQFSPLQSVNGNIQAPQLLPPLASLDAALAGKFPPLFSDVKKITNKNHQKRKRVDDKENQNAEQVAAKRQKRGEDELDVANQLVLLFARGK